VVLPLGSARAKDIEYQLHASRASCGDGSSRDVELHAPGTPAYDGDTWPKDPKAQSDFAQLLVRELLQFPSMQISFLGDFENLVDSDKLAVQLTTAARSLGRNRSAEGDAASARSSEKGRYDIAFSPLVIEAQTAQTYDIATGTWIGASLDQGVWYQTSGVFPAPGLTGVVVAFDMEFAYTHDVPCDADSLQRSCIELVVHITPRWDAMQSISKNARRDLNLGPEERLQYWSAIYQRIVTEPHTLMVHLVDIRRYWHVSKGVAKSADVENASERTLSTFTYR
jgi:hypothetical protein